MEELAGERARGVDVTQRQGIGLGGSRSDALEHAGDGADVISARHGC